MKRVTVMFAAALLTLSLAGMVCAEEAAPVVKKDAPAAEAKPVKKTKKKKAAKKGAEEAATPATPAKPAKKKEAAGC